MRVLREKRAQLDSGPIVVSTFNWGFRQMFENWAASCDHHKIDSRNFTLLFPTDERADALARDLGFVTYFDGNSYGDLPTEAAGAFGDRIFGQMLFAKIAMTMDMLDVGGDFLRQDVDLIWAKDPRGDLATRMDRQSLDMQFMYDGPSAIHQPLHYNSGFIFIRSNSFSRHMWKTVFDNYGQILAERAEQRVINVVAHCLRERGLRMERLPELRYINGHVISRLLRNKAELPKEWSVVHASWTSDIDRKIVNMKKFGLWYLD
ncbi:MAG: glycosyltransferase family 77 protein [Alphaproteobacteria bacterium]|nr:glycosyltransferase family 77 protein [Alphaproteobacteria bacterium]